MTKIAHPLGRIEERDKKGQFLNPTPTAGNRVWLGVDIRLRAMGFGKKKLIEYLNNHIDKRSQKKKRNEPLTKCKMNLPLDINEAPVRLPAMENPSLLRDESNLLLRKGTSEEEPVRSIPKLPVDQRKGSSGRWEETISSSTRNKKVRFAPDVQGGLEDVYKTPPSSERSYTLPRNRQRQPPAKLNSIFAHLDSPLPGSVLLPALNTVESSRGQDARARRLSPKWSLDACHHQTTFSRKLPIPALIVDFEDLDEGSVHLQRLHMDALTNVLPPDPEQSAQRRKRERSLANSTATHRM